MKKLTWVLGLLVLLGSTGMASADEGFYASGPRVAATVSFPGMRLVFGHPGIYCWYSGHYYSRADWSRFNRFHRDQVVYNRFDRDSDRRSDRDRDQFRDHGDEGHFNHSNYSYYRDNDRH